MRTNSQKKVHHHPRKKHSIRIPYLGKVALYWCDTCNSPLLEHFPCAQCGNPPRKVSITPPGDIRPAFDQDYIILRDLINSTFGEPIGDIIFSSKQLILLNRIGGIDRIDEVLLNGYILGLLQYSPIANHFSFYPRQLGGELLVYLQQMLQIPSKKQIRLNSDALPYILAGKSVLAPGVEMVTDDIHVDDYVLITYALPESSYIECVGIGIAQGNSEQCRQMLVKNYGQLAKTKKHRKKLRQNPISPSSSSPDSTFDFIPDSSSPFENRILSFFPQFLTLCDHFDHNITHSAILSHLKTVYNVNQPYITNQVQKAKKFIQDTISSVNKPVAVAYSGGKDSLGTLLLMYDTIGPNFEIFFADTGLELPEVISNVETIVQQLGMTGHLHVKSAGEHFWELVDSFGPPGRDYRYCCHSLKAQNITAIIEELAQNDQILVFLGQRQYESLNRAKSKMVYTNSFIPQQIAATPIKKWPSLLLWVTILHHPFTFYSHHPFIHSPRDIPVTPLYFQGHERLGCYLCPASNLATFSLLKETHPTLHDKWFNRLSLYATSHGLPSQWLDWGLWRFKQLPPQWQQVVADHNISVQFTKKDPAAPLQFHITKGFSPCIQTGYSIKGKFSDPLDLETLTHFLPALTPDFSWDADLNIVTIESTWHHSPYRLNMFADGSLFFFSNQADFPTSSFFRYFLGSTFRSEYCNRCGTCVSICPTHAIALIDSQIQIDPAQCTRCLKCISHCPFFQIAKNLSLP